MLKSGPALLAPGPKLLATFTAASVALATAPPFPPLPKVEVLSSMNPSLNPNAMATTLPMATMNLHIPQNNPGTKPASPKVSNRLHLYIIVGSTKGNSGSGLVGQTYCSA